MPSEHFTSYIMVWTSCIWLRWWWCSLCTGPTRLPEIFIMLAHWSNSLQVDMSLQSSILHVSWFRANQSLIYF